MTGLTDGDAQAVCKSVRRLVRGDLERGVRGDALGDVLDEGSLDGSITGKLALDNAEVLRVKHAADRKLLQRLLGRMRGAGGDLEVAVHGVEEAEGGGVKLRSGDSSKDVALSHGSTKGEAGERLVGHVVRKGASHVEVVLGGDADGGVQLCVCVCARAS